MSEPDPPAAAPDEPRGEPADRPVVEKAVEKAVESADPEALVRLAAPVRSGPCRVDPEDWSRSGGDDDERYQRERPPHWE